MPELAEEVKPSWGDMMEDLDGTASLPPSSEEVVGNIKKLIEFRYNEQGKRVKVTRTYTLETRKVSKSIAKRKTWRKFGLALKDNPHGPDPSTTYVGDDVYLSFTTNKEELDEDKEDPLKKLKGNSIVKCRVCKGDHWTTKCPYKDSLQPLKEIEDKEKAKDNVDVNAAVPDLASKVVGGGSKYVPPSLRGNADGAQRRGETMNNRRQNEAATLRVTNLSEDACEADLQELFRPFGPIARVYLAKDKQTNQSKGFAFVSYVKREDASRAIKSLQGYGYDHLILNVEWAKPSNN
ncbi:eukaryotic translation initiation factor 3 subunit G-like isoform X2 [Hydractinia symbiolongicarpus]|uniref:eukaryotic translation initiation factor 3 subunit G-like isoform X2 n=1 Tax=Hydractinia symbiolongicarpus TaxID=13093 RepID=UPI00254AB7D0|nr:eukaryotic translation initiation factor 3 subunit G-like isoform X2 [Hydractinia symbiolongicarpus]